MLIDSVLAQVALLYTSKPPSTAKYLANQCSIYNKEPEFLLSLLQLGPFKILFGVVYCPRDSGFWSDIENALIDCTAASDYTILVGDFNIDWDKLDHRRKMLCRSLHTCNLEPLPFQSTNHTKHIDSFTHTTIVYICVSDPSKVTSTNQLHCPGISTHDILCASFKFLVPQRSSPEIFRRSFRHFDSTRFLSDLEKFDWHAIVNLNNIDDKVNFFTSAIHGTYDTHAPYRAVKCRRKSSPWFTPELKQLIKSCNKAWGVFRKSRREVDHLAYKVLRNRVKTASRNVISGYYSLKFERARSTNEMWKCVDELGLSSASRKAFALPTDVDSLNSFFTSSGTSAPISDARPTVRISPDNRFYFSHVSPLDVIATVTSARSNARGPDEILLSYIKECLPVILPIIVHIFNYSLQSGTFPDAWKRVIVRSIPKRFPPREASDLRPISILCAVSKILESIIFKQISEYTSNNNLLDPLQSGFRKCHSTHTALLKIVEDFREVIDKSEIVLAAAIDLTQAFDRLNTNHLVEKLSALGFSDSACTWINSFLSGRSQVVVGPCS